MQFEPGGRARETSFAGGTWDGRVRRDGSARRGGAEGTRGSIWRSLVRGWEAGACGACTQYFLFSAVTCVANHSINNLLATKPCT